MFNILYNIGKWFVFKNNICMFDSELFYFDIVFDVCVYNNFIEIMKIIVREFCGFLYVIDIIFFF